MSMDCPSYHGSGGDSDGSGGDSDEDNEGIGGSSDEDDEKIGGSGRINLSSDVHHLSMPDQKDGWRYV